MAVSVYGLLRSAQGFADQAKVFQLYAGATLVDEFDDGGVAMMDSEIVSSNARAKLKSGISPVFAVPAGTTIMTAWIRVITAESAGATCTLGVGTSAAEWGTGLDCTSVANSILGATNDWVPLHFVSADTVDIVTGGATFDAFKCEVVAVCLKALNTY